jgi:hypothetical protein
MIARKITFAEYNRIVARAVADAAAPARRIT